MIKRLLCLLILFNICFVYGQDKSKIFIGQLLNSETEEPIQNAHVLSCSKRATISNVYGEFSIYVTENDTLTISCIGYQTTKILISKYPNFENKLYVFKITPIIYSLGTVEIPYAYSVVVIPAEKREKVDVEGVAPIKNEVWHKRINEDVDIKFERDNNVGKDIPGISYFGPGITITGFLSGLMKKETKQERESKEKIEEDKKTLFFDSYVKSDELKRILMNEPYRMSQKEYENFIESFILKAGKIKFATNEYDILQKITEELDKKQQKQ